MRWSAIFGLFLFTLSLSARQSEGYRLQVDLAGFTGEEIYLAYYFGDKQYIKDTTYREAAGSFIFQGEEPLEGGLYLIVLPPENDFFQVLIDENEQRFRLSTHTDDLVGNMQFQGAPDNKRFYDYLQYLNEQRPEATRLQEALQQAEAESAEREKLQEELEALNQKVRTYQEAYVARHPDALSAALIRANLPLDVPDFEGEKEEAQVKRWRYTQKHYFDNIDLADPRMLRTPMLFERVNYFVTKLQIQHPDTISRAIDHVLTGMGPAPENFKFFLIHFLNDAAQSKIVGMDAVYVHLVNKYYATGKADWTEEEQLNKILDNARSLEPLLIGKKAPDIRMQRRDGTDINLYDVEAEYTVLYIWRYDCGVCKKSTPHMQDFYEQFKDKGVKIFAACFKFTDEVPKCWEYVDENGIGDWIHVVDPYNQSRYSEKYYVKSTPQLYVLDKDKKILTKKISAEQLPEVMENIIQVDSRKASSGTP